MNFSDELWRVCGDNPFGLKKYARETREARRMGLPFSVPKAVVVPLLRYVRHLESVPVMNARGPIFDFTDRTVVTVIQSRPRTA